MKKFLSAVLALAMCMSLCISAFATEMAPTEEPTLIETDIIARAATKPTSEEDLPYDAIVTNLSEGTGTYTRYYFAPSGTDIEISGTLRAVEDKNDTSRSAKIYLYQVGNNSSVDSYTVEQFLGSTSFSHTFKNLDEDSHYFLDIRNTTPNNIAQDRWISGTVTIS